MHRLIGRKVVLTAVLGVGAALAWQPPTTASTVIPGASLQHQLQQRAERAIGNASARASAREGDEGEGADEVLARDQLESLITAAPALNVSSNALAAAGRQAAALKAVGGRWQEITNRPFLSDPVPGHDQNNPGSNYGVGWGLVSGRMTAITVAGGAVFAGGADGGVWRSTDRGSHWRPWSNGLPRLSVGALMTAPDGSVWVGLGEANTSFDAVNGMGVFRLARGSSAWQRVGGSEMNTRNTYELRTIGRWVYSATSTGLYRHAASGVSGRWQLVLKPDPNPTHSVYRTSHVTSVVAVPGTNGRSVVAAVGWRGGTLPADTAYNGFYLSDSGGTPGTFRRISLTGDINAGEIGRTSFDAGPTGGPLYAVVEDSAQVSLEGQGVFVSSSGNPAGPWKRVADPDSLAASGSALAPPPGYFPGVQAWYNQYVRVDPADPNHVYLGLEEVFESRDGGKHWYAIGAYNNFGIDCATYYYTCPPTTHPDQHAMAIAGGQVYAGSDGGMWRRSVTDHGRRGWINLNATLHTLQYYSVATGKSPGGGGSMVWGGLQDNGETLQQPGIQPLLQVFTGDGGDTIVDPQNGNRAVVEYVYADQFVTSDQGQHYREITVSCLSTITRTPIANCDPNPRFISPIEQDAHDTGSWVTGGQYVWVTHRGWDTVCDLNSCDWARVHDLGAGHSTTALAMSGRTVYAAYCGGPCNPDQGGPFVRGVQTNQGGTWHDITAGLPNRYITALAVDPRDDAHVLAAVGAYSRSWIPGGGVGHVFESRNGGRTWTDVSRNLPDVPALQVLLAAGHFVVATDVGVFMTDAASPGTWRRLGTGMPAVRIWDLRTDGSTLIAATHGRGMYRLAMR